MFQVEKNLKLFSIGFFIWEAGTILMTPRLNLSSLVSFLYHPVILVAYLGIKNVFIPEHSCEGCDQNFKGPGPLSSLPGDLWSWFALHFHSKV